MADRWTALNEFWNGFGLDAYDETTVPDGAQLPYITYSASVSDLDDAVILTASLWYRSNSWSEISQKAEEISEAIGGGMGVHYDGGRLWVVKGSPFAQRLGDEYDLQMRRIVLQVIAEYQ